MYSQWLHRRAIMLYVMCTLAALLIIMTYEIISYTYVHNSQKTVYSAFPYRLLDVLQNRRTSSRHWIQVCQNFVKYY